MGDYERVAEEILERLGFRLNRKRSTIHHDFDGEDYEGSPTVVEAKEPFTPHEMRHLPEEFENGKPVYLIVNDRERNYMLFKLVKAGRQEEAVTPKPWEPEPDSEILLSAHSGMAALIKRMPNLPASFAKVLNERYPDTEQ